MMEHLSLEEIQNIIMHYIQNSKDALALMINGEWGVGKTYYIENIIIPKIKKIRNKKVVKVSLYGIGNSKELYNKIYLKMMSDKMPKKLRKSVISKMGQTLKKTYEMLSESETESENLIDEFKINLPTINDIVEISNIWSNIENYVVIFDDLERCKMLPQEILAIINDFITEKKCKCIIIGNESEINKLKFCKDVELKYMVALNDNLKFNEDNYEKNNENINEVDKTKIDVSELKKRVDLLFKENIEYNVIKEKVIGKTIQFIPDIDEMIKNIVEIEKINGIWKQVIVENVNKIVELMKQNSHYNIRTLIYAFDEFQRIIPILEQCEIEKNDVYKSAVSDILLYMVYATIVNKTDNQIIKISTDYQRISTRRAFVSIMAFKFVNQIIFWGIIKVDNIKSVFKEYVNYKKKNSNEINDTLYIIMSFWDFEDNQIIDSIEKVKKKLKKGEYDFSRYSEIIGKMLKLEDVGFSENYLEEIVQIMLQNIREKDDLENYFNNFGIIDFYDEQEKNKNKFQAIMSRLKEEELKRNKENYLNNLDSILDFGEGWGNGLNKYLMLDEGKKIRITGFLRNFNKEKLVRILKESSAKDIIDFVRSLYSVYDSYGIKEYYADDFEMLVYLKEQIEIIISDEENEDTKKMGKIKLYNFRTLCEYLSEILERLK